MGKKSSAAGNAYRNPVENYRKQLGKNEVHQELSNPRSRARKSRGMNHRDWMAKSKQSSKNWKNAAGYFVLLLIVMGIVYVFTVMGAGNFLSGLLYDIPEESFQDQVRVHREAQ